MTELLVILGLCLVGLALSAHLVRWLMARPVGDADMNRVANLAREAAESFTRRQASTTGALAALLAGVIFLAYGLRRGGQGDPVPGLELGAFMTVSFAVGAASTVLVAHAATTLGARAAIRVASGALRSTDEALRCALRGGAAVALLTGTTSAFGLGALVLAVLVTRGAFGDVPHQALGAVPTLPLLLSGHALGASFAALFVQLSGGAFAKGADVGADVGAREAGLDDDDVDNPAAVADLAGDTAGGAASRAASALASAAVEDLAAMLAGAAVYALDAGIPSALAIVLFPTLTRAFGVLGAAFGSLVVRTDDRESPAAALSRGLGVAMVLHGVGLAGAAQWLLPDRALAVVACATVGLVAAALLVPWSHAAVSAERARVRDLADASRAGPSHAILTGLGGGLDATLVPAALGAVALFGAAALGARLGGPGGATLGLAMALLGASGGASYLLALDLASSAGDAALGIVEMTVGRDRRDVRGRLLLLGLAGTVHRTLSRAQAAIATLLAGALLASSLTSEAARRGTSLTSLAPHAALVAALAGAGLGAWVFTRATLGATRCARRVLEEVRRQLRDRAPNEAEPRAGRRATGPRSPDYGPCVELAARFSLRYAFSPTLAAVALPVACALALRWAQSGDKEHLVGPIVALVVAATVAGVLGSLLAATAGGAWANARKYIVTGAHGGRLLVDESGARAENPTYQAAVVGDTTGDPLKDAGAPALLIFVKLLPVLLLVLLPFLL